MQGGRLMASPLALGGSCVMGECPKGCERLAVSDGGGLRTLATAGQRRHTGANFPMPPLPNPRFHQSKWFVFYDKKI